MKLFPKILIGAGVVVVGLGIAYHLSNTAPAADLPREQQALAILNDGQCLMCHSENPNLPFYASLPIAKGMIGEDMALGYKHTDLTGVYEALQKGEKVDEATLAKIERVIDKETMPMARFSMMHWGSAITGKKAGMMKEWIREHRAKYYATNLAHSAFAFEPVQPVMDSLPVDPAKVALGNKLFHDPRFSADNTVSCASCHGLNTGGVDNKQYSEGVDGKLGGVNAPTVYNAALNFVQFWDGRAATLAAQAGGPPMNPVEMASASWEEIIDKLKQDKELTAEFLTVYPDGYSGDNLTDAIAEFEKTLLTPNSRFDQYLKGDDKALTAQEIKGYDLFKLNDCATCHVGANLGGQSYELMGLKADYFADRGLELTNEDNGRFKETQIERDRHRFKTPGLRNVALTAPYLHDGSAKTLEEAVDAMAVYQVGKPLSTADRDDIVAFLKTLTGEYQGKMLDAQNS